MGKKVFYFYPPRHGGRKPLIAQIIVERVLKAELTGFCQLRERNGSEHLVRGPQVEFGIRTIIDVEALVA
jgi:hypothetical protein